MKKKILVTGANGFVGKHLIKELIKSNVDVIGVGGPGKPNLEILEYHALDLTKEKDVAKINFSQVYGVIHLAGLAAVGESFNNPLHYITTNVGIEINLIEASIAQKCTPRFLIVSSGNLYAPDAPLPLDEKSQVIPSSPYAVSKIGQEQMALYYQNRGIECIIARSFNHFGPGQGLGFIVPDLAKQIVDIENGLTNKLTVGNLSAKRDYTDVRDIARAYYLLIMKGHPGEIYNVCSGRAYSGNTVLNSLLKNTSCKPEIIRDKSMIRPSDNPEVYGSHLKITTATGWVPEINFEKTIQDVLDDWRTRT